MDISKEREAFEKSSIVENYKDHMQSFSFNGNIYQYSNELGRLSVSQMACFGLSLTVVNSMWSGWLAAKQQAIPDGFVVVKDKPVAYMIQNKSWAHSHGNDYFEVKLLSEIPEPEFDDDYYDIEIPLYMIQEVQR